MEYNSPGDGGGGGGPEHGESVNLLSFSCQNHSWRGDRVV